MSQNPHLISIWSLLDGYRKLTGQDKTTDIDAANFIIFIQGVDRLKAENERLRRALAEYANHDNWTQMPSDFGPSDSDPFNCFLSDGWDIAETALAGKSTPKASQASSVNGD